MYQSWFNQRNRTTRRHILRHLLQRFSLCDHEVWLGKPESHRAGQQESRPEVLGLPRWGLQVGYFPLRDTSVLLLRLFNWLNQAYADYLGNIPYLKSTDYVSFYPSTKYLQAIPRFVFDSITEDCVLAGLTRDTDDNAIHFIFVCLWPVFPHKVGRDVSFFILYSRV